MEFFLREINEKKFARKVFHFQIPLAFGGLSPLDPRL